MTSTASLVKNGIREFLHSTGLNAAVARARKAPRILMLHGIGGSELGSDAFERAIVYLKRNFRLVTLDQAVAELGEPPTRGAPAVVLTFDDGLENNVTVAYPILARHGVPAAFFVCAGLVDTGRWLWTHDARARLASLDAAARGDIATTIGAAPATVDAIVERFKRMTVAERGRHLAALRQRTAAFKASAEQERAFNLASWAQLAGLDAALITIGSHSWSHEIMIGMDSRELEREVVASRQRIEQAIARKADYFCYPNGDFDEAALEAVEKNYTAALSTRVGVVRKDRDPLHALPRLAMPPTLAALSLQLARA